MILRYQMSSRYFVSEFLSYWRYTIKAWDIKFLSIITNLLESFQYTHTNILLFSGLVISPIRRIMFVFLRFTSTKIYSLIIEPNFDRTYIPESDPQITTNIKTTDNKTTALTMARLLQFGVRLLREIANNCGVFFDRSRFPIWVAFHKKMSSVSSRVYHHNANELNSIVPSHVIFTVLREANSSPNLYVWYVQVHIMYVYDFMISRVSGSLSKSLIPVKHFNIPLRQLQYIRYEKNLSLTGPPLNHELTVRYTSCIYGGCIGKSFVNGWMRIMG